MRETPLSRYLHIIIDRKRAFERRGQPRMMAERWPHSEVRILKNLVDSNADWDVIYAAFPGRSKQAVKHKIHEYNKLKCGPSVSTTTKPRW